MSVVIGQEGRQHMQHANEGRDPGRYQCSSLHALTK